MGCYTLTILMPSIFVGSNKGLPILLGRSMSTLLFFVITNWLLHLFFMCGLPAYHYVYTYLLQKSGFWEYRK